MSQYRNLDKLWLLIRYLTFFSCRSVAETIYQRTLQSRIINHVGLNKMSWQNHGRSIRPNMEIYLGDMSNEYAVYRTTALYEKLTNYHQGAVHR